MLDASQIRSSILDTCDRFDLDRHRGAARYVVDENRQRSSAADLDVEVDEAALGRTQVIGRNDQKCISARVGCMGR